MFLFHEFSLKIFLINIKSFLVLLSPLLDAITFFVKYLFEFKRITFKIFKNYFKFK